MLRCEYPVVTRSFPDGHQHDQSVTLAGTYGASSPGGLGAGPQEGGSRGVSPWFGSDKQLPKAEKACGTVTTYEKLPGGPGV